MEKEIIKTLTNNFKSYTHCDTSGENIISHFTDVGKMVRKKIEKLKMEGVK